MYIRFCALLIRTFIMAATETVSMSTGPRRLGDIEGLTGKLNHVIYHPPISKSYGIVIYFGGDVQDYSENMLSHRDNKKYIKWNLENTAMLLHEKFPNEDIFIIRPYLLHLKTFSRYSNFVKSNDFGIPCHETSIDAIRHLSLLIKKAQEKVHESSETDSELTCPNGSIETDLPISIIGFSKGCVVLNQLLFSFASLSKDSHHLQDYAFVKRFSTMYWLDGGHNGSNNTWITDKSILQKYCDLHIKTRIHVTPYQVKSSTRPQLGKEEKHFREILKKFDNDFQRTLYFEDQPRSLDMHFQVLVEFEP